MGVFLRDPSTYLHEFQREPRKTPNEMVSDGRQGRPWFEPGSSRIPVLSVTAVPLVGLMMIKILVRKQQKKPLD